MATTVRVATEEPVRGLVFDSLSSWRAISPMEYCSAERISGSAALSRGGERSREAMVKR